MKVVPKSDDARKRIKKAIEKSYIFRGLDKDQIKTVDTKIHFIILSISVIHV